MRSGAHWACGWLSIVQLQALAACPTTETTGPGKGNWTLAAELGGAEQRQPVASHSLPGTRSCTRAGQMEQDSSTLTAKRGKDSVGFVLQKLQRHCHHHAWVMPPPPACAGPGSRAAQRPATPAAAAVGAAGSGSVAVLTRSLALVSALLVASRADRMAARMRIASWRRAGGRRRGRQRGRQRRATKAPGHALGSGSSCPGMPAGANGAVARCYPSNSSAAGPQAGSASSPA